ncbi:carbohydrate-binding protein [Pedobacter sp. W3I1]|uniref:carbohydrate-binding protein n=1 Tax=Pedobacter sp. W3I1 TaxID=3042291 RepID=UPI003593804D
MRIDNQNGRLIGTLPVGSKDITWNTISCTLNEVKGKHDLFLVFKEGIFNLDWWKMITK